MLLFHTNWSKHVRRLLGALLIGLIATSVLAGPSTRPLVRGIGPEPESLDPGHARGDAAGTVIRDLYEGLLTENAAGKLIPGTADHWSISSDGRIYTFHIRESARWSNGDPVTAADFVAGIRRTVDPATGSAYASVLFPIQNASAVFQGEKPVTALGVTAIDKHTLRIELNSPTPYFLSLLAHHCTFPVYRPALKKYGDSFARPGRLVSNGAYRLVDWTIHSSITLERNTHYWDNPDTSIDRIEYLPIEDEAAELKRYRAGEMDITYTIPSTQFAWLKEHMPAELHVAPYLSTYFYGMNLTQPPLKNHRGLREALSMVIDRDVIANKIAASGQKPALGFVPPSVQNYETQRFDYADWPYAKRVTKARELYHAAGYNDANPLTIEIRYNTGNLHARIAQAVAAMWSQTLGVKTRLIGEEFKVFLQNRRAMQKTEVYRSGWVGDFNDAATFLDLFRSNSPLNDTGFNDERYDALLDKAAVMQDTDRRAALLEEAERRLLKAHAVLPLYYYVSRHLVKSDIGGWQDNVMDRHYSRQLYFRDGS